MARGLKFRIYEEDGLYYPCSENKGAEQLRGNREADLRLCFRVDKKPVFSRRSSYISKVYNVLFKDSFEDCVFHVHILLVMCARQTKSGSPLSPSEGEKIIEIMNDLHLEQLVHFPTREKNKLDLIITSHPGQFLDIQSPDSLSDHDIVSVVYTPTHPLRNHTMAFQMPSASKDAYKIAFSLGLSGTGMSSLIL